MIFLCVWIFNTIFIKIFIGAHATPQKKYINDLGNLFGLGMVTLSSHRVHYLYSTQSNKNYFNVG